MKATKNLPFRRSIVLRATVVALCACLLAIGLAGSQAEGCGWNGFEESVRFSNGVGVGDRLPPLPLLYQREWPEYEGEAFWGYYGPEICGTDPDAPPESVWERIESTRAAFGDATDRIDSCDMAGAKVRLERLVRESRGFDRDGSLDEHLHAELQLLRNRAIDLLDVVGESEHGVSDAAIQSYAKVRLLDLAGNCPVEPWTELMENASAEPRLADNVAYINGAYLYSQLKDEAAAKAFDELGKRWPKSEKRVAATYMSGVAWLRRSEWLRQNVDWRAAEDLMKEAAARLETVASSASGSVYAQDARGWLARAAVARYDYPPALVEYYTRLADREDRFVQLEAARSLNLVRRKAEDEDMLEVERRIERTPDVALVYAYYEIYNHESFEDPDEYEPSPIRSFARTDQLNRIVAFCSRMSSQWPAGTVGAGFALRVAGACLELDRFWDADRFARRALESGPNERERVQAFFLAATAKHRLADFDGARTAIEHLRAAKPDAAMDERAGRLLAKVCEDDRDLAGALDEYRRLGYEADAAYVIDVLMPVGELEAYVGARPGDPDVDWLRYALGVRLLRTGLYERAERAFASVRTTSSFADNLALENGYYSPDERLTNLKQSLGCDSRIRTPRQSWVARDVQTAKDLAALERMKNTTFDRPAAAEAHYQFAAYLFDHEALLFYNPSLWWGNRAELLNSLDDGESLRLPGEAGKLWDETNRHDALAQSVDAFLDVVDKYPDSPAAADALYSAAVAHERLANFNGYWRTQYENGLHAGRRMVTYDDVRRAYPGYALPLGTRGWEASTRTVNGGPAWTLPPPKPKAVPLWRHYAKRIPEVMAEFGGPVVAVVWGTIRTAVSWIGNLARRAAILALQALLLTAILGAWIAAVRSSYRLACDAASGQKRAKALLPPTSEYRPWEQRWFAWAADRITSHRHGVPALSITGSGAGLEEAFSERRLDDRVVLFIERARLFAFTTPEGLACVLVVVTHVPIFVLMVLAM